MSLPAIDFNRLTTEERLDLIERIWDSLGAAASAIPLTPTQRDELDRRLDDLEREGPAGVAGISLGGVPVEQESGPELFLVARAVAGLRADAIDPTMEPMKTIGFIGAGKIGSQVARLAIQSGHDVVLSNSRGPDTLAGLAHELGPKARVATAAEAGAAGELVVVSIPLKNIASVPVEPLAGKIVIDTNNYYPQRDGHIRELDEERATTSELLQRHLPSSKVVKAFNHIYAAEITTTGQAAGTKDRRALVIAGDDPDAKVAVALLLDQFGFDAVDAGPLSESWRIQRDTPGYGPRRSAGELRSDLAAAKRPTPVLPGR
jgi:putative addiction module component (TIGR02574 family)